MSCSEGHINREEQFDKNLELAREFFRGLLDRPVESWPESGTTFVFTPSNDEELTRDNLATLREIQERHPGERSGAMYVVGERVAEATETRSDG